LRMHISYYINLVMFFFFFWYLSKKFAFNKLINMNNENERNIEFSEKI
jgi:hypothetical protein